MTAQYEHGIRITEEKFILEGILGLPADPRGVVVFAHRSGSGRLSPRNNFVTRHVQQVGLATVLLDLLTEEEEDDWRKDWVETEQRTRGLPVGHFGASTGAGAAL